MDDMTPAQRRRNMQHIRSKDTQIEVILRRALWHAGIRYRKNYDALPGKPDIAITKYRIAIFCDGEFFHGRNWNVLREKLKSSHNSPYWTKKISRNIHRDMEVIHEIESMGWTVIRFWGTEIKSHPEKCVKEVHDAISEKNINRI